MVSEETQNSIMYNEHVEPYLNNDLHSHPRISAEILCKKFGSNAQVYFKFKEKIRILWERIKNNKNRKEYDNWLIDYRRLYGYKPSIDLFFDHIYLIFLAKAVAYIALCEHKIRDSDIFEVASGSYFRKNGITNFLENDFSVWLLEAEISKESLSLFWQLALTLSEFDFSTIEEDIFREIYEDIVRRGERHRSGEYYTPEWLVELILNDKKVLGKHFNTVPKILDPACGSGTFLYRALRMLRLNVKDISVKELVQNVTGIDINPIATTIAKTNYILAIVDLLKDSRDIELPIHTFDCLESVNLFLNREQFEQHDLIIGNPPWVVMRSVTNGAYQSSLKNEALKYNLLEKKDTHLFTQMELATLFFCKCADVYLKKGGVIAFIMPRSVIAGTAQHKNFRKFQNPPVALLKIIDLEEVVPLFNMPACILIGLKGKKNQFPVNLVRYSAELPDNNIGFIEAKQLLRSKMSKYIPPDLHSEPSYYYHKFRVGASLFPRSFYFVEPIDMEGFHLKARTAQDIYRTSKHPWQVEISGLAELEFIYSTLLSWEMVPFGYLGLRLVILPVKKVNSNIEVLDVAQLIRYQQPGIAGWLEKSQIIWDRCKTEKAKTRFPRLVNRLDYNSLLSCQNKEKRYIVLYNATGTNITSCIVDRQMLPKFAVGNNSNVSSDNDTDLSVRCLEPNGFIVDVKTWYFETENEHEAYYLSAMFNSDVINKLIKPLQPRGLFGARAIHRRPLLYPIPKFNEKITLHRELADLSNRCSEKIKIADFQNNKLAKKKAKQLVNCELVEINRLVSRLLNITNPS